MRNRTKVATLVVLGLLVLIVAAQPVFACDYGCTPGFWKNLRQHGWAWDAAGYNSEDDICSVFVLPTEYDDLCGDTLHEALSYKGGPGTEGAARILLRAAVAALLNSAYDEAQGVSWGWHWWYDNLVDEVHEKLDSDLRYRILNLARDLDDLNNAGCPLGRAPD